MTTIKQLSIKAEQMKSHNIRIQDWLNANAAAEKGKGNLAESEKLYNQWQACRSMVNALFALCTALRHKDAYLLTVIHDDTKQAWVSAIAIPDRYERTSDGSIVWAECFERWANWSSPHIANLAVLEE